MLLTSLNKHLQAVKYAKQTKKYLQLMLECDCKEKKKAENKVCLYDY